MEAEGGGDGNAGGGDSDKDGGMHNNYTNIKYTSYVSFFATNAVPQNPHDDTLIHGILA